MDRPLRDLMLPEAAPAAPAESISLAVTEFLPHIAELFTQDSLASAAAILRPWGVSSLSQRTMRELMGVSADELPADVTPVAPATVTFRGVPLREVIASAQELRDGVGTIANTVVDVGASSPAWMTRQEVTQITDILATHTASALTFVEAQRTENAHLRHHIDHLYVNTSHAADAMTNLDARTTGLEDKFTRLTTMLDEIVPVFGMARVVFAPLLWLAWCWGQIVAWWKGGPDV